VSLALELEDVSVSFPGGVEALHSVGLRLHERRRLALLGLNGSGKTTLLMAAAGLVPHTGTIHVAGQRLTSASASQCRRRLGFVFAVPEDQLLFPKVLEDVAFSLVARGLAPQEAKRRAARALEQLDALPLAERSPHELSHGERVRVALAGAIVTEPALLLLDEPAAGLDPPTKRRLAKLLCSLDAAMLIATHDLDFARCCCQGYVLLDRGVVRRQLETLDALDALWAEEP
jgi:cobalt/nickel transport system ATP-binding protein